MTSTTLNRFFVYGTLRPGEGRWSTLEAYAEKIEPAVLYGAKMYTTGAWPFLVMTGDTSDADVQGELITVKDADVEYVTRMLDAIEGYDGDPDNDLFTRSVEDIYVPGGYPTEYGYVKAYVYLGGRAIATRANEGRYKQITSGDWKKRNECQ